MAESLFAFGLFLIAIVVLGGVRNHLVYHIRIKRIGEIGGAVHAAIRAGSYDREAANALWDSLHQPSYTAMVMNVTRWTYEGFYANAPTLPAPPLASTSVPVKGVA